MKGAKICAWVAVLLLVPVLTMTVLSFLGMQTLTSAGLHQQTATDSRVVEEQMARIGERMDLLAEEYGFSAEKVKPLIRKEDLLEANREVAAWWTRIITEGVIGEMPKWQGEGLEDALAEEVRDEEIAQAAGAVRSTVQNVVLPVRETLLTTGVGYLTRKVDLANVVCFAGKAPLFGLALSVLAAGLVALFLGNNIRSSLKYYGIAAAGAGIATAAAVLLARIMNLTETIRQVTQGLAEEFDGMMGIVRMETLLAAFVLLAAGMACLFLYRRGLRGTSGTGSR